MPVIILPAGVHALGTAEGVQLVDPQHPPFVVAKDINATTGEVNSLLTSINPIDNAVIQIARTRRGSGAAVLDIGHRLHEIKKLNEQSPTLAEGYVREMYKDLTDAGHIEITNIDTEQFGTMKDGLGIFLTYTLVATGETRQRVLI